MYNEASTAIPTLQQLSINRTRLLVVSGVSSEWVYNLSVDTFTKEQSNLSKTEAGLIVNVRSAEHFSSSVNLMRRTVPY